MSLSSFIWSVADLLRGDYKQSEYGKVILQSLQSRWYADSPRPSATGAPVVKLATFVVLSEKPGVASSMARDIGGNGFHCSLDVYTCAVPFVHR
jgi:hypothetical protein